MTATLATQAHRLYALLIFFVVVSGLLSGTAVAGPAAPVKVVATQEGEGFVINWTAPDDLSAITSLWRAFYYVVEPGVPFPNCGDPGFTGRLIPGRGAGFAMDQTSTTLTASTILFGSGHPPPFVVGNRYIFCVAGVDANTFFYDYALPSVVIYADPQQDSAR